MYDSVLSIGDFDRKVVLLLGDFPVNIQPFTERNLVVQHATIETAKNYFKQCKTIVVAEHPSKYGLIRRCFEQLFPDIENHGISLKIGIHSDADFLQIANILRGVSANHFFFFNKINELAETIARYSPGPPVQDVEIDGDISNLDEEAKLLLCRSFYDCKKIHVELITGGTDAKYLLKVYAWIENSEVKSSMLPFFVKISSPEKIEVELNNYRVYTDLYINFQYRPNCRIERCVHTKKYKALVGNFVDDSISLRKALEDTYHTGIIYSLFEKSLRGFRRQPSISKHTPSPGSLATFIKNRIKIEKLIECKDVIEKAINLGLNTSISHLHDKLVERCTKSCITGPIHGDLHAENIMVSGHDAILIDFSAVKPSGPLTADPTSLEVSLCFDISDKIPSSFENWKAFIDEAYNPSRILRPLAFTDQIPNEFSWLRRAIREIRHILIGCECDRPEIEAMFACYLMRIARLAPKQINTGKKYFEFKCRAYALVVAERIINSLT